MASTLFQAVNRLGRDWAEMAAAVSMGAVAVAMLACLGSWLLRRESPTVRHALWLVVAAKLLTMPLWTWPIAQPALWGLRESLSPSGSIVGPERAIRPSLAFAIPGLGGEEDAAVLQSASSSGGSVLASWPLSWQADLLLVWMAGVAWSVARIARMRAKLVKCLRQATTVDDPGSTAVLAELTERMGLKRAPQLVSIDGIASPFVYGLLRPTLVLPRSLKETLATERWQAVILHELAHLRRGDLAWAWLPELSRIVLWFHPVSHWVASRARLERELACDGLAMALAGVDASSYAQTIVDVLSLRDPSPFS